MKVNKNAVKVSIAIMILSFIMIVLGYRIKCDSCSDFSEMLKNIGYGVFCSGGVALGIALSDYFTVKHNLLKSIYDKLNKYSKLLNEINYFDYTEATRTYLDFESYFRERCERGLGIDYNYPAYIKLKQYDRPFISFPKNTEERIYINQFLTWFENIRKELVNSVESYRKITYYPLEELLALVEELDFFTSRGNKKYKVWLNDNIVSNLKNNYVDTCNMISEIEKVEQGYHYYKDVALIISKFERNNFKEIKDDSKRKQEGLYEPEVLFEKILSHDFDVQLNEFKSKISKKSNNQSMGKNYYTKKIRFEKI